MIDTPKIEDKKKRIKNETSPNKGIKNKVSRKTPEDVFEEEKKNKSNISNK